MDHLEQQQLGLQCTSLYTSKGALCRLVTSHDGVILPVLPTPPHHSWTKGQSLSCAFFEQPVPQYQQTLFTQLVHISRPFSLWTFDNEPLFQLSTIKSHGKTKTCWALGVIGPCASHHNCLNSILKQKDYTGLKGREGERTAHFCQMLKKSGFVTSPQTSSSQREDWLVMAFN